VERCSDEGRLVLRWTEWRSICGRVRPHVDGANLRVVGRGPARVALALATTGGRRTATAATVSMTAATEAMTTTTTTATTTAAVAIATIRGRRSARSVEGGGGGLVALLRATGGGEGRGGFGGSLDVERQLLQEEIVPRLTEGR
jgi:hypothetical protein